MLYPNVALNQSTKLYLYLQVSGIQEGQKDCKMQLKAVEKVLLFPLPLIAPSFYQYSFSTSAAKPFFKQMSFWCFNSVFLNANSN